jgi:small subunit ribosomal protein S16
MGNRNAAFYRVIVQDSRYATTGRFIETLGWYDPKQEGNNFSLNLDRVNYWLSQGAQPSDTVRSLVKKADALPAEKAVTGTVTEEEVPAAAAEAEVVEEAAEETQVEETAEAEVVEEAAEETPAEEAAEAEVVEETAEEASEEKKA